MKLRIVSALSATALLLNAVPPPTSHASTAKTSPATASAYAGVASVQADCKSSQSAIPVPAGVLTMTVAPSSTNPLITGAPGCPHYVALSATARRQPELFVFLPGTNIEPLQNQMIVNQAAMNGYYAVGLSYFNIVNTVAACEDPVTHLLMDNDCYARLHEETWTGANVSPVITVPVTNSLALRLNSLIEYLDTTQPNQGWGQFRRAGGGVEWSKVRLSGHSLGSLQTSFMATQVELARACTFAGPTAAAIHGLTLPASGPYITRTLGAIDYYVVPMSWVTSTMATPAQRVYSFAHDHDADPQVRAMVFELMGHANIAGIATVDGAAPPYGGSHALTTTLPISNGHAGVVVDDETPLTLGGLPKYAPVWQTMCFANHPNPEPEPELRTCDNQCPDLGDAPDSGNSLGNPMSIHPFGLTAQPAFFPTEYTAAPGTGPVHWNAGSNQNPNGIPLNAIDSALGLEIAPSGVLVSRVSNERNAFLIPDQDARKRNIIPHANPALGRSNRDGFDNAFRDPTGAQLPLVFAPCTPTQITYSQFVHTPWAMNGFYTGTRYINVWADFNRDGDWADNNLGAACPGFPNASVDEWLVRNIPAPNGSGVFMLPPQLFPNNADGRPFWLRISISDTPAPAGSIGNGPAAGYRFGETEDHLLCHRGNGVWAPCLKASLDTNGADDGAARVAAKQPVAFTATIDESAAYPVTVTWTIEGSGVSLPPLMAAQANASRSETAERLKITRVIPSAGAGLGRDTLVLGWYGCITCTLAASAASSVTGIAAPLAATTSISVTMTDADGNQSGDDMIVTVGSQIFVPLVRR